MRWVVNPHLINFAWPLDVETYSCNQISFEIVHAERSLEIVIGDVGNGFAIDFKSLDGDVNMKKRRVVGLCSTYNTEVIKIALLIGLLKGSPGIIRAHILDARFVKDTIRLTIRSLMA